MKELERGSIAGVAIAVVFYLISTYSYLLFHNLVELFSIYIAITTFLITALSRHFDIGNYYVIVGTGYLFVGIIDLIHTLAYQGMPIFTDYDYYANQLWIGARYLEAVTLVVAILMADSPKRINMFYLLIADTLITAILILTVFKWKVFPECFIEGQGQTPFKIYSEYIIISILVMGILLFIRKRSFFPPLVYRFLVASMLVTILSEFFFTLYQDNFGLFNAAGHLTKVLSFYLMYRVMIAHGIREPYDTIFHQLKLNEELLKQQNKELERQSNVDALTGIYNRRYLFQQLEEEMVRQQRYLQPFSIFLLDLDHFKKINDEFGHLVGDQVLIRLARIMGEELRETDITGRFGGEEFLILMPDTGLDGAAKTAERVRKAVEDYDFGLGRKVTISGGVAEYDAQNSAELVEEADQLLYQAKKLGRNRIEFKK